MCIIFSHHPTALHEYMSHLLDQPLWPPKVLARNLNCPINSPQATVRNQRFDYTMIIRFIQINPARNSYYSIGSFVSPNLGKGIKCKIPSVGRIIQSNMPQQIYGFTIAQFAQGQSQAMQEVKGV